MSLLSAVKGTVRRTAHRLGLSIHLAPVGQLAGLDLWRDIHVMQPQASMVFDIGANTGQTIDVVRKLWPHTRIVAFEPSPASLGHLRSRTPDQRLTIEALAMSDAPGTLPFHVTADHSVNDSLRVPTWERNATTVTVAVETVDGYCAKNGIARIDVLKIDTQGHDLSVLQGARVMLQQRAIGVVCAEVMLKHMYDGQPGLTELLAFGQDAGYEFVGLYEQTYWDNRLAYANICWRAPQ